MKLNKKKSLASSVLGVGKERIVFNVNRLEEIKEAITKQDIRDLVASGAISVREIRGTRKVIRRHLQRGHGSKRRSVNQGKRKYMILTRKLRGYLAELRKQEKISDEQYQKLRREIRGSAFKSKSHMKERMKLAK